MSANCLSNRVCSVAPQPRSRSAISSRAIACPRSEPDNRRSLPLTCCPSCRAIFATFKQLLDHCVKPCYPDTGESGDTYDPTIPTTITTSTSHNQQNNATTPISPTPPTPINTTDPTLPPPLAPATTLVYGVVNPAGVNVNLSLPGWILMFNESVRLYNASLTLQWNAWKTNYWFAYSIVLISDVSYLVRPMKALGVLDSRILFHVKNDLTEL